MDLKQLEYFVRVVELGSFTRAALALDIAQPALSRQVRTLEVELRQNLLVRNGRGVTPTEAGALSSLIALEGAEAVNFALSWQGTIEWKCASPLRTTRRKNWFVGARPNSGGIF